MNPNLMTKTKPVAPHLCCHIPVCCVSSQTNIIGKQICWNIYLTETVGGQKINWKSLVLQNNYQFLLIFDGFVSKMPYMNLPQVPFPVSTKHIYNLHPVFIHRGRDF